MWRGLPMPASLTLRLMKPSVSKERYPCIPPLKIIWRGVAGGSLDPPLGDMSRQVPRTRKQIALFARRHGSIAEIRESRLVID